MTTTYDEMTKAQLYEEAQKRDVEGRSTMTKDELVTTLSLEDTVEHDAVELVLAHHKQIRRLFASYEGLGPMPSQKKEELVGEMITVLVKHARMEELVLYPAVRRHLPDLREALDEGLEEHHLADHALAELRSMSSDDERFDMKVHVMIETVNHHLEEEERDLLPKIGAGLPTKQLLELGEVMVLAYEAAPIDPHTSAPQTPPGNVISTLLRTPVDVVRNVVRLAWRKVRR